MQLKNFQSLKSQRGSELLEFSLVLPIVLGFIFGIILFAWIFNNYLTVAYSASRGARFIEMSRGFVPSPCTEVVTEILTNSPTLNSANLTVGIKLGTVSGGVITLSKDYPVYTSGTNNCATNNTTLASALGTTTTISSYTTGTVTVNYALNNILGTLKLYGLSSIAPVLSSTTPFIVQ